MMNIIKKTKSICPICIVELDSQVIEENNKIYMLKKCKKHGTFKNVISNDADYYKKTTDFYYTFDVRKNKGLIPKKQEYYNMFLTMECILKCPVCYVNAPNKDYKEPTIDWIKNKLKYFKNVKVGMFGGEPTLRKDIVEITKLIKDSGNIPALHTDGIKIGSNYDFLKKIKDAGLVDLHLQFDGFDEKAYEIQRGEKLLNIKKKALDNIKKLDIGTILQVTLSKDVNDKQIKPIFDFSIKNDFVKGILYKSVSYQGVKGLSLNHQITVDDQIKIFERETKGRVTKKDFVQFQKLFYIYLNLVKTPRCFYNHYFVVLRTKEGYKTISELINLNKLEKNLDKYKYLYSKNKIQAYLYLSLIVLKLINHKTIPLFYHSLILFINKHFFSKHFVFGNNGLTNKNKFLIIEFGTICDMYNFDHESTKNCDGGEITTSEGINTSLAIGNVLREKKKAEAMAKINA